MKNQITRRDFLKLAGFLPLGIAAPRLLSSSNVQQKQQNVIIIVFDALSAQNISLYGYQRETMPNLTRLSERAVVYHNHFAGGNFTTPGTASLLTGTLPWTHRAFDLYGLVDDSFIEKNIFAAFHNYYRLAYTHNPVANKLLTQFKEKMEDLVPIRDLLLTNDNLINTLFERDENTAVVSWARIMKSMDDGYAYSLFLSRLYEKHQESMVSGLRPQFPRGIPHIAGNNYFLLEDAIDWLGGALSKLPQPFIGYFHFMPPHDPYNTPQKFIGHFDGDGFLPIPKSLDMFSDKKNHGFEFVSRKRTKYDEFILYADQEFGRLMNILEETRILDNTWVVLTSDHGEMFERGIVGHLTPVLYQPVVRIPLLIFEPGRSGRTDIYSNTSAADVLPTLLHVSGNRLPDWTEGIVLPPFEPWQEYERTLYIVQARKNAQNAPIYPGTTALIKGRYKLMYFFGYDELGERGERIELYDLENDPEELHNVYSTQKNVGLELLNELKSKLAQVNEPYL